MYDGAAELLGMPLLEGARVRLLLSDALERADGHAVLWLPYLAARN